MIKNRRIIIIIGVLILVLNLLNSSTFTALETNITVEPSEPTPLSKITFIAKIEDKNVSNVKIYVQECNPNFCFTDWTNVTLQQINLGEYQGDVTLKHSDATYIYYWLVYIADGIEYNTQNEKTTLNLKINSNNGNDNNSNNSPGFELIVLVLGIALLVFILKKKR